ncbi:fimbria/pilus periplasmic chaperone [Trinickia sp. YCB016]
MKSLIRPFLAAACIIASLFAASAHANVVIAGTRVIYPAGQSEVSVKLSNEGDGPALVQSWLDSGDENAAPEKSTAPFMLTPPLARIDAHKGQTLRLVYLGEPLPADRESVFYLNVLDIPPNARPTDERNLLQVAFRTRIKIFFRPEDLPGNPDDAADQLKWKLVRDASGDYALECSNASAFHVSFNEVTLVHAGQMVEAGGGMAPPEGTARFVLKGLKELPAGPLELRYTSVNDYGAAIPHQHPISP